MAKYVGKIFRINNAILKVKRTGTHYVHVQWYNPFKRMFYCRVITSLEHKHEHKSNDKNKKLKNIPHRFERGNCYVFSNQKYKRLREGKIIPIPTTRTEGFELWSGYEESRYLSVDELKGNEVKQMKIKKKAR